MVDSAILEDDFPLQQTAPGIRPMHRSCVLKGCGHKSRFLLGAGWTLALGIFAIGVLALTFANIRPQDQAVEKVLLPPQQRVSRPSPPPPPVQIIESTEMPTITEQAPVRPAVKKVVRQVVRHRVVAERPLPNVPESEKWWNQTPLPSVPDAEKWWTK